MSSGSALNQNDICIRMNGSDFEIQIYVFDYQTKLAY